jgi:DNA polymerase-2
MKGFIVYSDYDLIDEQTTVKIFGRLENNQSFVSLNKLAPYFFVKEEDEKAINKLLSKYQIEHTKLTTFKGEKVIKISSKSHIELNKLSSHLHEKGIDTFEADIKPHIRFIIDNNLLGSIELEGEYDTNANSKIDRIYSNPKITPSDFHPKLKVASIDLEASTKDKLYCIGIHTENKKINFMVTDKKLQNTIPCKTEEECLEKFKEELIKLDPDIITGWNMIDFDLVFLQNLFKKHKIPFDLGRTNDNVRLRIESNFMRDSSADIPGRLVLDAMQLIQDPFIQEAPSIKHANFESYTLENVSQAILGKGKLIKGEDRSIEIEAIYNSNSQNSLQKLSDYNLMDCELAYKILEKTGMIDLQVERSQLTGMQLDRVTSSIANFDSLYIREAHKRGLVSPTTKFGNKEERIKGGYVFSSHPGIYHNVLIFDFKSLYPSIIKTFNIDPSSFLEKNEKGSIEAPNKAHFRNSHGILPDIISKLHNAREKAKKEKRELSSYAIKIIMNSFFGVLASPNCRYFSLNMANAITHFGQMIIKLTAQEIEKKFKLKVIYSDTDSVFIETNLNKDKANKLAIEIQDYINNFYKKYVKENYNRDSYLELEFEKQYLSLIIPQLRMKSKKDEEDKEEAKAAKKRYAGLVEINGKEEIEITGLEAIRGDWTEAAQEFQKEILDKVFHKEEVSSFIKSYINKIKEGKLDSKLIYRKSIRKNLDEYTKTTPPHVKAARKLPHLDSNIIEYYITEDGPEPIQKLKHKLDYEHYIDKQIKPIANQVLVLFGKDFDDLFEKGKQTKLF